MAEVESSPLSAIYFEDILKNLLKNTSVKVLKYEKSPCGASDGFLSVLKRVIVDYSTNKNSEVVRQNFIVKTKISDACTDAKIGEKGYNITRREMDFFSLIAPRIEKIVKNNFQTKTTPTVFKTDDSFEIITLEDLNESGFYMIDKNSALNESQTRLTLQKLAKFHAASIIIHQTRPKIFDNFDFGFFNRNIDVFHEAFLSLYEVACDEISTWEGFEKYAESMKKMHGNFIENGMVSCDVKTGDFCVLNHGDLWKNNVMFKTDENGSSTDVILVRTFF